MSQIFTIFLNVLAPVFSLVLIGFLAGPRLKVDARSLSRVAYFILVPAFVFNVFSRATIEAGVALRMAGFIVIVTLICVAVAILVAWALRRPPPMIAAYALLAAFGNVGNFGLPIIQFKLGEEALVAASAYFVILSFSGFVIGVMAATWYQGGGLGAVGAAFKTPGVVAVLPAFLVNGMAIEIPLFVERAVALLAGALIPVMLLTLGIQLAGMGRLKIDRDVVIAGSLRLLVGPAVALVLAGFFGLTGIERGAGILQASMPAAVLASLIALEHDLLPDFVTTAVLFSTLASAVTLTVVLAIV